MKVMSDEQQITDTIDRLEQRCAAMERQRDAWRAACKFMYDTIRQPNSGGVRPVDMLDFGDWGCFITLVGKAQSLEDEL